MKMTRRIELDGRTYDYENLSEQSKKTYSLIEFTSKRIDEVTNMQALLQRAKNSYIDALKKEMLSSKAGFLLGDD